MSFRGLHLVPIVAGWEVNRVLRVTITTSLPAKCVVKLQKNHLPKEGKDWTLAKVSGFYSYFSLKNK